MKQNKHIDDHINRLLHDHEAMPALSSFDAILSKLEKKRRRKFFWLFFTGLGIPGSIGLLYLMGVFAQDVAPAKSMAAVPMAAGPKHTNRQTASLPGTRGDAHEQGQAPQHNAAPAPDNTAPASHSKARPTEHTPVHTATFRSTGTTTAANSALLPAEYKTQSPIDSSFIALPIIAPAWIPGGLALTYPATELLTLGPDSAIQKKKKRFDLYLGINLTPQASNYYAHGNDKRDPIYSPLIATEYRESKTGQAKFRLAYSYGIRLKLDYLATWEFMAGLGIQKYTYREKSPPLGFYPGAVPNSMTWNTADPSIPSSVNEDGYRNILLYNSYSLEAAKLFHLRSLITLKAGIGLQVNQLTWRSSMAVVLPNPQTTAYLNHLVYVPHIKAGVVYTLSKKIQLQLCPDLYYSLNSAFKKNYIIKQNTYGVGLEANLTFKIR